MKDNYLPCLAVFRQPMIRVDGSVTVCNYDLGLKLKLGNINKVSFEKLWYDEKITKLRINHITGKDLPEKCINCKPDHFLTRNQTIKYLKLIDRKELAHAFLRRIQEKIKILLVNPQVSEKAPYKMTVTLGLGYLAAYIRKHGYQVKIINMPYQNLNIDDVVKLCQKEGFNIIGITGMTYQIKSGIRLAKYLKNDDYTRLIVFGGPFATLAPREILLKSNDIDLIVMNEGEETLLEIIKEYEKEYPDYTKIKGIAYKDKNNNLKINPKRDFLDINSLPFPARDLMPSYGIIPDDRAFSNDEKGVPSIMAMFSRGCPANCIFCATPKMWRRRVRYRNLDLIIEEIKHIIANFNIKNIVIDDDSFTVNKKFVIEFCKRIIKENLNFKWRCNTRVELVDEEMLKWMRKAGCVRVTYGVESGNPDILKVIRKNFTIDDVKKAIKLNHRVGLPGTMLMIIGHPYETKETVNDSVNLVKELNPKGGYDFQIMQPHPGTELREVFAKKTGKILTNDWDDYFSDNITYLPEAFKPKEFLEICRRVTGRPVKFAGSSIFKGYKENNTYIIEIPPQHWEYGFFDEWNIFYWEGDETCNKGFTHTLGKNYGEINYFFDFPYPDTLINSFKIKFRACTQTEKEGKLEIYINNKIIKQLKLPKKSLYGKLFNITLNEIPPLKKEKNELKFKIPRNENAQGISIMYRPLENTEKFKEQAIKLIFYLKNTTKKNKIFKPIPLLILDTVNFCDLKCIMCPIGKENNRKKHIMSWGLMEKILNELTSYDFKIADTVFPFWNGEPLLYPYIEDMFYYVMHKKNKNFNYFSIHTNANKLTKEKTELFLKSNLLGSITFSVDAALPKTYEKIRKGGDLIKVEKNIIYFIKKLTQLSLNIPIITVQFLVMPENFNEVKLFIKKWKKIFNDFSINPGIVFDDFYPINTHSIFIKRTIADNNSLQVKNDELHKKALINANIIEPQNGKVVINDEFEEKKDKKRRPCVGLFENLGIRYDGLVSACCRDFNALNAIGNIFDNNILELWEGEALKFQRMCHINGEFHKIPLCKNCKNQPNHRLSNEEINRYLNYIKD